MRQRVLVHAAILHHEPDAGGVAEGADVGQGVAVGDEEVGALAGLEGTQVGTLQQGSCILGPREELARLRQCYYDAADDGEDCSGRTVEAPFNPSEVCEPLHFWPLGVAAPLSLDPP